MLLCKICGKEEWNRYDRGPYTPQMLENLKQNHCFGHALPLTSEELQNPKREAQAIIADFNQLTFGEGDYAKDGIYANRFHGDIRRSDVNSWFIDRISKSLSHLRQAMQEEKERAVEAMMQAVEMNVCGNRLFQSGSCAHCDFLLKAVRAAASI